MRAELSPVSSGGDAEETSSREIARRSSARAPDASSPVGASSPSSQPALRRLFQDDGFERAARRPLVALG
jgi:hypothetical protein